MASYYNEIDPYCVEWLRNLIKAGHIAEGEVDDRSIADVRADDLKGFTQCHFFAGLGGWSYALRLAGWGDDAPVWTGSCPCQPFSAAGARKGFADERHLWPEWFRLIGERRPAVVFGEQVARAADWLALVRSDLEAVEYAVGCMPIEAASVGANHKRDRFWFVADTDRHEYEGRGVADQWARAAELPASNALGAELREQPGRSCGPRGASEAFADVDGGAQSLADADRDERHGRSGVLQVGRLRSASETEGYAAPGRIEWAVEPDVGRVAHGIPARVGKLRALGNAIVPQVAAQFVAAYLDTRPYRLNVAN